MKDLRERAIRGGFARVSAQSIFFVLRVGTLMVLARLLDPKEFGLVGMVTAFTGVLNLFRDFGLSTATVQRATVTDEQISTLFWINVAAGAILGLLLSAFAPVISSFYHEPRLFWVTIVLATGFLFNAAGVQHSALLQRQMRFTALAMIQVISLVVSTALGIGLAVAGYGYWALVVMSVILPLVSTACFWLATSWIPRMPRRRVGVRPLIRFGGTVTLNSLVVYLAYNLDKILLGRYWGAEVLGLYGRSYQIITIPTDNLNSAVGEVAFAALSRVQDDPKRLKSYFLKGYSLVVALTVPITIIIALFSHDLVMVILGAKWNDAAAILQLLAPSILIFALMNPVGWLLASTGMVGRCLKIGLVITPVVTAAYVLGLPYGPRGIAFGFSAAMTLLTVPLTVWGVRGTVISFRDVLGAVKQPLVSGIVAAVLAIVMQFFYGQSLPPVTRLLLGSTMLFVAYSGMLLYVMGQKAFYIDLLRGLTRRPSVQPTTMIPVVSKTNFA
jgi:O-antigen/teichoic acid export membrane protein